MASEIESLERYEQQLRRLHAQVGTVDPASAGFQARLGECASCSAGLERELQRLVKAPPAVRAQARAQLQRLVGLNALVQEAVRLECAGVAELIQQTRLVSACLGEVAQPVETGDSCDVRG
jgi:hypothetical protein